MEPTAKQISVSRRQELFPFPFIQVDVPPWFITTDLLEWTHETMGFFVVTAWIWWMWRRFFHKRGKKAQAYCRRAFLFRDSILIHSLFLRISKHPILVLLLCLSVSSPTSYHSRTNERMLLLSNDFFFCRLSYQHSPKRNKNCDLTTAWLVFVLLCAHLFLCWGHS